MANNKGITLVELVVVMTLMGVIIAGAVSVQVVTNKVVVERKITTDQRHIVEMIKDDLMTTLTYVESVELSNEKKKLDKETYSLGCDETKGYIKNDEAVFGSSVYNGNTVAISFQPSRGSNIMCTIKVWEKGGISLEDTFSIRLLNIEASEIMGEGAQFAYVYYSDTEKPK